jgi:hypothetical protein
LVRGGERLPAEHLDHDECLRRDRRRREGLRRGEKRQASQENGEGFRHEARFSE